MLNSSVESAEIQITIEDRYKDLANDSNFWFLRGKNVIEKIQHESVELRRGFGEVKAETLASSPEKKLNEDAFLIHGIGKGRTLLAVLDGASSQKEISGLEKHGVNGAFYASHLAATGFTESGEFKNLSVRESLTAKDVMEQMNAWIFGQMKNIEGIDYSDSLTIPGMASVILIVDEEEKTLSLAQAADSMAISVDSGGHVEILTPNLNQKFDDETMEKAEQLALENNCTLAEVRGNPDLWKKVKEQLQGSFRKKINTKGGVGILNGMKELFENKLVYTSEVKINPDLSAIILFSDGAILPYQKNGISYQKAADDLVASVFSGKGKPPLSKGAEVLSQDPDFTQIPRLKKRDDATLILVTF